MRRVVFLRSGRNDGRHEVTRSHEESIDGGAREGFLSGSVDAGWRPPRRPEILRALENRWFYRKSSSPNNDSKDAPPRRRNTSQASAALPRKIFSGEARTSFDEPIFAGEIKLSWPERSGPNAPTFHVDGV